MLEALDDDGVTALQLPLILGEVAAVLREQVLHHGDVLRVRRIVEREGDAVLREDSLVLRRDRMGRRAGRVGIAVVRRDVLACGWRGRTCYVARDRRR